MKAPDVATQAGITYRQLDHWVSRGYLKPRNPQCGSGYDRTLDPTEVRVAIIMGGLVNIGLTPARAATIARTMAAGPAIGLVTVRVVLAEVTQA